MPQTLPYQVQAFARNSSVSKSIHSPLQVDQIITWLFHVLSWMWIEKLAKKFEFSQELNIKHLSIEDAFYEKWCSYLKGRYF